MKNALPLLALLWLVPGAVAAQEDPETMRPRSWTEPPVVGDIRWSGSLEIRAEAFDTPSSDTLAVNEYGMTHVRLRGYADYERGMWRFHAGVMGAFSGGLRDDYAFAIGRAYAAANPGQTLPGRIYFLEGTVGFEHPMASAYAGRMKYADGAETDTRIEYLDKVKRERIEERLIGNWDWPVLGRRFDGAKGEVGNRALHAHGYYLKPLQGGINYGTGYRWFDDLNLYGGSLTLMHGLIPATEVRAFLHHYDDSRAEALGFLADSTGAGAELGITTYGLTVLVGNETSDAFVWVAKQSGTWGTLDHDALAYIVEAGHRFGGRGAPTLRGGLAQASGQDDSDQHTTFFNVMPTNHKFYGMLDYNAFSNLRNVYVEASIGIGNDWTVQAAGHSFWLMRTTDAWYGGSGAFDDHALGYAGRRPGGTGDFSKKDLGQEVDLTATWRFSRGTTLSGGTGWFFGSDAAKDVLTAENNGFWGFLRAVTSF